VILFPKVNFILALIALWVSTPIWFITSVQTCAKWQRY